VRRWVSGRIAAADTTMDRIGPVRLRRAGSILLAAWFAFWAYQTLAPLLRNHVPFGQDIRIYYRAVQLWLDGGNPWSATIQVEHSFFSFAGSPATLLVLAPPAAILSENRFVALWLVLSAAAAILTVRWLRLPFWWLLFPPTVEAIFSLNPQLVILALLLAGRTRYGGWADTIAVALKAYALIPLLGERTIRRIIVAGALTAASVLIVPSLWISYLGLFGDISARIAHQSKLGYSAFYFPVLLLPVVVVLVLLWLRDRKTAAWLAVPAVWPASEFHYSTMALPVMTPILAVLLAVPVQRLPPVAIFIDVSWRLAGARVKRFLGERN
jgi:hypothetical protein